MTTKRQRREYLAELETVDLEDVDIMAAGVRVHGQGSPPEGDVYSREELERIAKDSNAIVSLRKPVNKIGHSFDQKLASTVGLTPGEMPALGWLNNFRVHEDAANRPKLYADIRGVPRKFADLIKAGAFRTRSAEVGPFRAQTDDGTQEFEEVVKGLAWHGAQPSAFQTLDDIYALFESPETYERVYAEDEEQGDQGDATGDITRVFFEPVPPAGSPADTYDGSMEMNLTSEQATRLRKALGLGEDATLDKVFEAVEAAPEPTPEPLFTDEQLAELRTKLGLDKDADAEKIFAAVDEKTKPAPTGDPNSITLSKEEFQTFVAKAERGDRAFEDARIERRDRFFADAVKSGRIEPAAIDKLKESYDKDELLVRATIEALPENEERSKVYGSDETGVKPEDEDAMYAQFAALDGGDTPSLEKAGA